MYIYIFTFPDDKHAILAGLGGFDLVQEHFITQNLCGKLAPLLHPIMFSLCVLNTAYPCDRATRTRIIRI